MGRESCPDMFNKSESAKDYLLKPMEIWKAPFLRTAKLPEHFLVPPGVPRPGLGGRLGLRARLEAPARRAPGARGGRGGARAGAMASRTTWREAAGRAEGAHPLGADATQAPSTSARTVSETWSFQGQSLGSQARKAISSATSCATSGRRSVVVMRAAEPILDSPLRDPPPPPPASEGRLPQRDGSLGDARGWPGAGPRGRAQVRAPTPAWTTPTARSST